MILILRGHIRSSFDNMVLHDWVESLSQTYPIRIFIHTWNIYQNSLCWRYMPEDRREVTEDTIHAYFGDLRRYIQKIIIEDDSQIVLAGKTEGFVGTTRAPLRGWKNYWYGQYAVVKYIVETFGGTPGIDNECVVNTRFDLFNNSNSAFKENIQSLISQSLYLGVSMTKDELVFMHRGELMLGLDNFFMGRLSIMYSMLMHFHFDLEDIIQRYPSVQHQEYLVFYENERLLGRNHSRKSAGSHLKQLTFGFNR